MFEIEIRTRRNMKPYFVRVTTQHKIIYAAGGQPDVRAGHLHEILH